MMLGVLYIFFGIITFWIVSLADPPSDVPLIMRYWYLWPPGITLVLCGVWLLLKRDKA